MVAARKYLVEEAPDKVVVDVEDPPPIAIGRVATRELTMQVLVAGHYHRRTPDLSMTSCGHYSVHSEFHPPRREELTHPLSRDCGCFTPYELQKADEHERKRFDLSDIEPETP